MDDKKKSTTTNSVESKISKGSNSMDANPQAKADQYAYSESKSSKGDSSASNTSSKPSSSSASGSSYKSGSSDSSSKSSGQSASSDSSKSSSSFSASGSSSKSGSSSSASGSSSKSGNSDSSSKSNGQSASGSSSSSSKSGESKSSSSSGSKSQEMTTNKITGFQQEPVSGNASVLNEIYSNAQMGKQSIGSIIPKISDENLKKELATCYENYDQLSSQSASELIKIGAGPREKNPLSKAVLWGTINVSTLMDDSPSNIANLLIKGSHNSVNNITRAMNQHSSEIDQNIKKLADAFIQQEQTSISTFQKFL